jgi:hypothetical protein
MPRPVANIVRLRLCDAPHGSSNTFGRTAAALPVYLHRLALEEGECRNLVHVKGHLPHRSLAQQCITIRAQAILTVAA